MSGTLRVLHPCVRDEERESLDAIDKATEKLVELGWSPAQIARRSRDSAAQIVAMNDPRLSLDLTEADH